MKALRSPLIVLLITGILLGGCNATPTPSTPDANAVATQVNKFLTSIPAQTVLPSPVDTQAPQMTTVPTTAPSPTITVKPTNTEVLVTPTVASTPTTAPTATSSAGDPRSSLGKPTFADNLDTSQYWGLYEDDHIKIGAQTGYLELVGKTADGWHGWTLSSSKLTNFYVEETAKPGTCAGADSYGLMVRSPNPNQGYFFEVSCDGKFLFHRWDGNTFIGILDWKADAAINKGPDQVNRLGVKAVGSNFTLYVNGVKVGEASDSTYTEGVYGLFVSSMNTSNFTVQVDQVDYWTLP